MLACSRFRPGFGVDDDSRWTAAVSQSDEVGTRGGSRCTIVCGVGKGMPVNMVCELALFVCPCPDF